MKTTTLITGLSLCSLLFAAAKEPVRPTPAPVNPSFDTKLYQLLAKKEGNVFFSPYSISECMGMVYAGAGGNTAAEIAKALSYGKDAKLTAAEFKTLRAHLAASVNKGEDKLSVANGLCITGEVPLQAYQDLVREQFEGELFSGGLEQINGWVKQKTQGNIDKILEELSPDSACVLLNAVYFKGSWKEQFRIHNTHKAPFRLDDGKQVNVDMMMREGSFRVVRDKGLLALELPYQNSCSMVLIQPDKPGGMEALEKGLNDGLLLDLNERLAQGHPQDAELYLPKFKIETEYDLVDAMKALGLKNAFVMGQADFKNMVERSDVAISQIKHKATLEVDEKGSVATAATAVEFLTESAAIRPSVPKIRFDRPFLVLIRERATGTNLFVGRISDPTK